MTQENGKEIIEDKEYFEALEDAVCFEDDGSSFEPPKNTDDQWIKGEINENSPR